MFRRIASVLFCCLCAAAAAPADTAPDMTPVRKWLTRQQDLRTLQADFVQKRAFKNLRDPLSAPGHLWYSAPDQFRWELGDPPRTVVVRKDGVSFAIDPARRHAERTLTGASAPAGGMRAMPMMDFPFAKDFDDFNRKFETLSVTVQNDDCHLELKPRDPQMGKFITAFRIDFDTTNGHLLSFELATRDGSSLRSEFSNVRINQKIDPHVFDYDLTGYEVVDAK